jgi:hypothetical protein
MRKKGILISESAALQIEQISDTNLSLRFIAIVIGSEASSNYQKAAKRILENKGNYSAPERDSRVWPKPS